MAHDRRVIANMHDDERGCPATGSEAVLESHTARFRGLENALAQLAVDRSRDVEKLDHKIDALAEKLDRQHSDMIEIMLHVSQGKDAMATLIADIAARRDRTPSGGTPAVTVRENKTTQDPGPIKLANKEARKFATSMAVLALLGVVTWTLGQCGIKVPEAKGAPPAASSR